MIKSFTIDHTRLKPGIYVSREDSIGKERATTYDLRVCLPNKEQLTPEIAHTIEHLMADYLRNELLEQYLNASTSAQATLTMSGLPLRIR